MKGALLKQQFYVRAWLLGKIHVCNFRCWTRTAITKKINGKIWFQNFLIQIEKRLNLSLRESPDQGGSEKINESEKKRADKEDILISIGI